MSLFSYRPRTRLNINKSGLKCPVARESLRSISNFPNDNKIRFSASEKNVQTLCNMTPVKKEPLSINQLTPVSPRLMPFWVLTSSFRLSHRPHGLSSRISLSSSESSPLSLGDLCSDSLLLDRLPGMAETVDSTNAWLAFRGDVGFSA